MPKSFMSRDEKLNLIYRHTHPDCKTNAYGERRIMVNVSGTVVAVPLKNLTDAEIAAHLPYAVMREEQRKSERAAKKLQQDFA